MRLAVRVTPKASINQIDGRGEDASGRSILRIRVPAVPKDGKANKAACLVLAKALCLPKSSLRVVTGHTARLKGVEIDCAETSHAARQIRKWMADDR